ARGVLRLVHPHTCAEFARLEDPNQDGGGEGMESGVFSPDGTQLVTTNNDSGSIHIWDLRALRKELATMGLDWDAPPYPEAEAPKAIDSVVVDWGNGLPAPPTAVRKDAFVAPLAMFSLQIALTPYHPEPYRWRGLVYARRGESDKAITDFTE